MTKYFAVLCIALVVASSPELSCQDWYEIKEEMHWNDFETCVAWGGGGVCMAYYLAMMAIENALYVTCLLLPMDE